jgi:hypothetical protein
VRRQQHGDRERRRPHPPPILESLRLRREQSLALTDPSGLDPCQGANNFAFSQDANGTGIFTQDDCSANVGTWAGAEGFLAGGGTNGGNGPSLQSAPRGCVYVANPDDFGWGQLTMLNCAPSGSSGGPNGGSSSGAGGSGDGTLLSAIKVPIALLFLRVESTPWVHQLGQWVGQQVP